MPNHNFIDLKNKQFGHLTVLKRGKNNIHNRATWLCRCICGSKLELDGNRLRTGNTKSCGCMSNVKDVTGKKFGKLTALKIVGKDLKGYKVWLCSCECGGTKKVPVVRLTTGNTKSCGCIHKLTKGIASRNKQYYNYKYRAKKDTIEFNLSFDDFVSIVKNNCHYCNSKPKNLPRKRRENSTAKANGIDRKNSKKGYIKSNCVPCCKICNQMKGTMTVYQFKKHIKLISDNF